MLKKKLLASASALALLASIGAATVANADVQGTPTTQSALHNDSAVFWIGQANGATSCNAVSQTSTQDTLTIPAVAGMYAYITALTIQTSTDATGATAVPTLSFTGIGSSGGAAPILSVATTLATTGYHQDVVIPFPVGGLKSTAPGTAVTIVPSAAMSAHTILCMTAVGYYNNN